VLSKLLLWLYGQILRTEHYAFINLQVRKFIVALYMLSFYCRLAKISCHIKWRITHKLFKTVFAISYKSVFVCVCFLSKENAVFIFTHALQTSKDGPKCVRHFID